MARIASGKIADDIVVLAKSPKAAQRHISLATLKKLMKGVSEKDKISRTANAETM